MSFRLGWGWALSARSAGASSAYRDAACRCRSTIEGNPHGRTVERALSYISTHATDGIGANDIAHHLGISRRTLDARFREMTGSTVLAHIQSQRLDAVKKLLTETTDTIESIIGQCGFGSANHLKKIFKRTFGCSMREWRLSH